MANWLIVHLFQGDPDLQYAWQDWTVKELDRAAKRGNLEAPSMSFGNAFRQLTVGTTRPSSLGQIGWGTIR